MGEAVVSIILCIGGFLTMLKSMAIASVNVGKSKNNYQTIVAIQMFVIGVGAIILGIYIALVGFTIPF